MPRDAAATLTVIWWRDIPAQVLAREGRRSHKIVLHPRFQVAIDKAAMKANKRAASDYIGEWRREARPFSGDLETAAATEAGRLETAYTRDVLARLIESGGVDPERSEGAADTFVPDERERSESRAR